MLLSVMLSLFVYLAIFHGCAAKKTLPVFLLDYDNVMSHITLEPNPLAKLNENFFTDLVYDAIKRADCVVIFAEKTLCTEDLSIKDRLGTPYYHLQKGVQDRKVMYLPGVMEPFEILTSIFEPVASNIFHLGQGTKLHLLKQYKYIYVFFSDNPDATRIGALRNHDAITKEVYFAVRQLKPGPIVAFYTGKVNPIHLEQIKYVPFRSLRDYRYDRGFLVETPSALLRLNGVTAMKKTGIVALNEMPTFVGEETTDTLLTTTIQYSDVNLQFYFELEDKIWKLAKLILMEADEEVGRTQLDVYAPWKRSYYCAEPITIINTRDGSSITISEYQVEPFKSERRSGYQAKRVRRQAPAQRTQNNITVYVENPGQSFRQGSLTFSRPVTCGTYFNAAILAAQMIFLMFFVITMWGVVMLYNCGRNSRFDDPNQKPLVIAQEAGG